MKAFYYRVFILQGMNAYVHVARVATNGLDWEFDEQLIDMVVRRNLNCERLVVLQLSEEIGKTCHVEYDIQVNVG